MHVHAYVKKIEVIIKISGGMQDAKIEQRIIKKRIQISGRFAGTGVSGKSAGKSDSVWRRQLFEGICGLDVSSDEQKQAVQRARCGCSAHSRRPGSQNK
jgi:hypothetical protein